MLKCCDTSRKRCHYGPYGGGISSWERVEERDPTPEHSLTFIKLHDTDWEIQHFGVKSILWSSRLPLPFP
jgi:hypothetical protein